MIDPSLAAAGVAAAGGLLGGALSGQSGKKAQEQAQRHQVLMRGTQYQATVKDMKKAGLNPMMLAQGSALSQGMGAGTAPDSGAVGEAVGKASSKYGDALMMRAQLENTASGTQLNRELSEKAKQDAANIFTDTYNKGLQGQIIGVQADMSRAVAEQNLANSVRDGVLTQAQADQIRSDMGLNATRRQLMNAQANAANSAAATNQAQLPGLNWENSAWGIGLKELRATISTGADAFKNVKGGLGAPEIRQQYERKGGGPPPRRPDKRK